MLCPHFELSLIRSGPTPGVFPSPKFDTKDAVQLFYAA